MARHKTTAQVPINIELKTNLLLEEGIMFVCLFDVLKLSCVDEFCR